MRSQTLKALWVFVSISCVLSACSRTTPEKPAPDKPESPSASASGAGAPLSEKYSRPAPARLVAIGDLHGDLDVTRRALRLAGAIDAKDAWVGGDLVVVQTGDEIDRADDDRKILDLFERLKVDAKKTGGEVIALTGNHELMNASHDFRYVTPGAFAEFGDERARAAAFSPGGTYAKIIAERPVVVKVGDSVFMHGGILPKHLRYGLDRINDEVRAWLLGQRSRVPEIVVQEDGPVWTRMYSAAPGREECAVLGEVLRDLKAKRLVMGHTVQRNGINPACDEQAWRIDTGLSKAYGGKLEVLEIRGDTVSVRRPDTDGSLPK